MSSSVLHLGSPCLSRCERSPAQLLAPRSLPGATCCPLSPWVVVSCLFSLESREATTQTWKTQWGNFRKGLVDRGKPKIYPACWLSANSLRRKQNTKLLDPIAVNLGAKCVTAEFSPLCHRSIKSSEQRTLPPASGMLLNQLSGQAEGVRRACEGGRSPKWGSAHPRALGGFSGTWHVSLPVRWGDDARSAGLKALREG